MYEDIRDDLWRFIQYVNKLGEEKFFKESQGRITFKLDYQSVSSSLSSYFHGFQENDFKSLLLSVRKFILEEDSMFINRIYNMLETTLNDDTLRKRCRESRKILSDKLKKNSYITINGENYSNKVIVKLFTNGLFFHQDKHYSKTIETLPRVAFDSFYWVFIDIILSYTEQLFYIRSITLRAFYGGWMVFKT